MLTALAGALIGAAVGWFTIFPIGVRIIDSVHVSYHTEGLLAVAMWAVMAVVAAAGAGLAVAVSFRDSALRNRLGRTASIALLISGTAIVFPTVAFAGVTGFSTQPGVVMLEAGMVLVTLVAGLITASECTARRGRPSGRVPENAP